MGDEAEPGACARGRRLTAAETTFELELLLPERPLLPKDVASLGLPETPSPLKVAVTPHETLADLRATLNDSPEGYWLGAFAFRRQDGARVDEWAELCDVFGDGERVLRVTHEPYNGAEVRLHLQRLRDLLMGPQMDAGLGVDVGATVHDAVAHAAAWAAEAHAPAPAPPAWRGWPAARLHPPHAEAQRALVRCVRGLSLSAWNPPPPPLALQGHLLYLQIDTLEGAVLHVTASVHGFYVCNSTSQRFDPSPRTDKALASASLFDLLCAASPLFLQNFARLFNDPVSTRDYFSALPVTNTLAAAPWLAREAKHDADLLRTQAAFLLTGALSADTLDAGRDWNEELQASREMPRTTLAQRLMRDRVLNRLQAEFTLAAVRAVPRVAAGEIPPMNPSDAPDAHMYLFNNLFLSKGLDGVGIYAYLGGDAAAHAAVGKDVQGVRAFSALDVEGLALLGTVVVDWLGERWVVQSVLPGLFRQSEAEPTHVAYGGVEGPDTIHTDAHFHELLAAPAKRLHLATHTMRDAAGAEHALRLSVDCKGLYGADGRRYLLDVSRLCPVDVAWLERDAGSADDAYPHRFVVLRPELLEQYWDVRLRAFAREKLAAQREQGEAPSRIDVADFALAYNPDAFVEYRTGAGYARAEAPGDDHARIVTPVADEADAGVAAVRAAAAYLRDTVLVRLVSDVAAGLVSAVDGLALTQQLHARGINMRYLGHLARLSEPSSRERLDPAVAAQLGPGHEALLAAFRRVVVHEMVVRAAKHRLRAYLRGAGAGVAPSVVAHFANCLLGAGFEPHPAADVPPAPFGCVGATAWAQLTPAALADEVRREVRVRFRFELPPLYLETELRKPPTLRALCLRMGVQLRARDYVFDVAEAPAEAPAPPAGKKGKKSAAPAARARTTFVPGDVLGLVPTVKTATAKSALVEEAFEAGRLSFSRGDRELGAELMLEGISFHEQVYGLVHPETARCYALFAAMAHHHVVERVRAEAQAAESKDAERGPDASADPPIVAETMTLDNALRFQRQAVTVSERTLGLDHPDTMVQYINLAVMERTAGDTDAALRYQERVLALWQLLYGRDHPDAVHTLSSVALVLQGRHELETSLRAYEAAHDLALRLFGPDSIYTGNMAHELSQAHTLSGDLKSAIQVEKEAWRIFTERLGKDDALTQESQSFLSSLASSAVRVAKLERVAREQHARELVAARSRGARGARAEQRVVQPDAALADRPIDELVQFIQGAPGTGMSRSARKRAARAKRTET